MKWITSKNKKTIVALIILIVIIAGLLDIKYKGLLYQLMSNFI
ncbi:hypothetical protein ACFSTH_12845 [Paenibacillus yanchengensis]|uniref:Uncharacterized protein n=1 Tax=Paenibacillus yanchengensis TaxID=2035833 RepID=A0ABW4YPC1_9BACL